MYSTDLCLGVLMVVMFLLSVIIMCYFREGLLELLFSGRHHENKTPFHDYVLLSRASCVSNTSVFFVSTQDY